MSKEMVFGIAGLAIGAALGAGGLWLSTRPTSLSRETAHDLLSKEYAKIGDASCAWSVPTKETSALLTFSPYNVAEFTCAEALASEGLAEVGPCIKPGCGGPSRCCSQLVKPVAPGVLESQGDDGISFPCGRFVLGDVTTILTNENRADVRFERTFRENEGRLKRLEACKLEMPQAGKAELSRVYWRGDDGVWRGERR